jgi:hypothetical protein
VFAVATQCLDSKTAVAVAPAGRKKCRRTCSELINRLAMHTFQLQTDVSGGYDTKLRGPAICPTRQPVVGGARRLRA